MAHVTKEVLRGTLDDANPLAALRGNGLVWTSVFDKVDDWYREHVDRESTAFKNMDGWRLGTSTFPTPTDLNINMMPISFFDRNTLPDNCKQYTDMIRICPIPRFGPRVVYLTIHEGWVDTGKTQRRPGLHIERPGAVVNGGRFCKNNLDDPEFQNLAWGLGHWEDGIPVDGIYMASSVADSCAIWPALITSPEVVTDKHGGIEHMRPYIGDPTLLPANQLCWFTDRTPHEAMPASGRVYRQFFRLVVGKISMWYSKHNTANPLGVEPEAPISDEDKFA